MPTKSRHAWASLYRSRSSLSLWKCAAVEGRHTNFSFSLSTVDIDGKQRMVRTIQPKKIMTTQNTVSAPGSLFSLIDTLLVLRLNFAGSIEGLPASRELSLFTSLRPFVFPSGVGVR
mmetsp:Transcript_16927/g.35792  ORF Transcript_16927/g.35792 Transcript_16927/m.35792 type:complete len:117 (+) Transcript_16927:526-876(+)